MTGVGMSIDLDYQRSVRPFPWAGAVVLASAIAVLMFSGSYYRDTLARISYWEAQAGKIERASIRQTVASPRDMKDMALEIKHANEVLTQITLPWDSLFQAVEWSAGKDVALLTIEPDAERREVKISGEAKNIGALLNYIGHLSAQEAFSGVYLRSHQVQRREREQPVRFALVVAWKMAS